MNVMKVTELKKAMSKPNISQKSKGSTKRKMSTTTTTTTTTTFLHDSLEQQIKTEKHDDFENLTKKTKYIENWGHDDVYEGGRWTKEEDLLLREAVQVVGPRNWKQISSKFLNDQRSDVQCLHRWQKVLRPGLVKGHWTKEEDETIVQCIEKGMSKWSEIASLIPGRIGKQCRERWFNHLDPTIKKGEWTAEEDAIVLKSQSQLGNQWCKIAKMLPGRSENAVKNRWNSTIRKRLRSTFMKESLFVQSSNLKESVPTLSPRANVHLPEELMNSDVVAAMKLRSLAPKSSNKSQSLSNQQLDFYKFKEHSEENSRPYEMSFADKREHTLHARELSNLYSPTSTTPIVATTTTTNQDPHSILTKSVLPKQETFGLSSKRPSLEALFTAVQAEKMEHFSNTTTTVTRDFTFQQLQHEKISSRKQISNRKQISSGEQISNRKKTSVKCAYLSGVHRMMEGRTSRIQDKYYFDHQGNDKECSPSNGITSHDLESCQNTIKDFASNMQTPLQQQHVLDTLLALSLLALKATTMPEKHSMSKFCVN